MGGEGLGRPVSAASINAGDRARIRVLLGTGQGVRSPRGLLCAGIFICLVELRSYEKLKQDTDESLIGFF